MTQALEPFDWSSVDMDTLLATFGCVQVSRWSRKRINTYAVVMAQALAQHGWDGQIERRRKGQQREIVSWLWQGQTRTPAGETLESILMAGPRVRSPLTIYQSPPPTWTPLGLKPGLSEELRAQVRQWMLERTLLASTDGTCAPRARF